MVLSECVWEGGVSQFLQKWRFCLIPPFGAEGGSLRM
jgi:hypothetical protein